MLRQEKEMCGQIPHLETVPGRFQAVGKSMRLLVRKKRCSHRATNLLTLRTPPSFTMTTSRLPSCVASGELPPLRGKGTGPGRIRVACAGGNVLQRPHRSLVWLMTRIQHKLNLVRV